MASSRRKAANDSAGADRTGVPVNLKRRPGQPLKLHADETTLKTIRGLGGINATVRECAAVFKVTEQTFHAFMRRHPIVREILEDGRADCRISLRRMQFRLAEKSAAMAIFLGKNYLGQSDRQELEHTGPGGGPLLHLDLTKLTDEELNAVEPIIAALAASAGVAALDQE